MGGGGGRMWYFQLFIVTLKGNSAFFWIFLHCIEIHISTTIDEREITMIAVLLGKT